MHSSIMGGNFVASGNFIFFSFDKSKENNEKITALIKMLSSGGLMSPYGGSLTSENCSDDRSMKPSFRG